MARGEPNPLLEAIAADPAFGLERGEIEEAVRPERFIGRAPQQVDEFLAEVVQPVLAATEEAAPEPLRV